MKRPVTDDRRKGELSKIITKDILETAYYDEGKSLLDIAEEYNCSWSFIRKLMDKYGLKRRGLSKSQALAMGKGKHERYGYDPINEAFFSEWTPQMAWVLGLLLTDGNILKNKVNLHSVDLEMLLKVRQHLGSQRPIMKIHRPPNKTRFIYRLEFYRERMREDLAKLEMVPNKSLILLFPEVPEKYMRHFIRGLWDGDGSVYLKEGYKLGAAYISASYEFMQKLVEELYKAGINAKNKQYTHIKTGLYAYRGLEYLDEGSGPYRLRITKAKNSKAYYIRISSKESLNKLFDYFYKDVDESIYLKRKYAKFLEGFMKLNENRVDSDV